MRYFVIILLISVSIMEGTSLFAQETEQYTIFPFPCADPSKTLSIIGTPAPGGLAVDKSGNAYVSDRGSGANDGKIIMLPKKPKAMRSIPLVIVYGLYDPGDIEVSPDGRGLLISDSKGNIIPFTFGLSIKVLDVVGATVYVQHDNGITAGYPANPLDGYHHIPAILEKDQNSDKVVVFVEYEGKTKSFLVYLTQSEFPMVGQTVRWIYFNTGFIFNPFL